MSGTLYVVGTPIGNLGDFSPRAVEILRSVDFIAAEDTRVTLKLLKRFEIQTPMISYHEHNLRERGEFIISKLLSGENGAIVSDAGMPCVSDPGEDLVHLCCENGILVQVIPGPVAAVAALSVSGLPTSRFIFEGFLSANRRKRLNSIADLKHLKQTLIFYEAPHKLARTFKDLHEVLGDRKVSIVKEITKIHEGVVRTTLKQADAQFSNLENSPKGEFVLIVEGANQEQSDDEMSLEDAIKMAKELKSQGLKASDAAKNVASISGYKKSEIYKKILD